MKILILGAGNKAQEILNSLRRDSDKKGFNLVGFIHIRGEKDIVNSNDIVNLKRGMSRNE